MKFLTYFLLIESVLGFCNDVPRLTVRGEAQLKKPADELVLIVGVTTEAENANTALQKNSQKMQKVIVALKKLELEGTEYKTGRFQISPQYAKRPQNNPDWQPSIEGYLVTNSLVVTSEKIRSAGQLIDALTQAGANTISNIRFGLKNPDEYRKEAIAVATQNAMRDAEQLAQAANQRLKRILFLSLDQADQQPLLKGVGSFEVTPIEPGDVEVTASVNVIYELATNS